MAPAIRDEIIGRGFLKIETDCQTESFLVSQREENVLQGRFRRLDLGISESQVTHNPSEIPGFNV